MQGPPNETMSIVVSAQQLVESGALLASSPLVRGDTTLLISQDVTFDGKGEYYELHYRVVPSVSKNSE